MNQEKRKCNKCESTKIEVRDIGFISYLKCSGCGHLMHMPPSYKNAMWGKSATPKNKESFSEWFAPIEQYVIKALT